MEEIFEDIKKPEHLADEEYLIWRPEDHIWTYSEWFVILAGLALFVGSLSWLLA